MNTEQANEFQPLAAKLRPTSIEQFAGQKHLLGIDKPLYKAITQGILHSMILWGPPGTGKTTLANLMAKKVNADFIKISAIFSGVKEIREVVQSAKKILQTDGRRTVLFVDEIHRFNKTQQDAFLPFVEEGVFVLIGATTENPSFQLNNALLSRARVYVLTALSELDLHEVLLRALNDTADGLGQRKIIFPEELQSILLHAADGDARQLLNLLEIINDFIEPIDNKMLVTTELLTEVIQQNLRRFDHHGEAFYDQISALHKSMRGSDPDAALYWFCRMIDGGCDPLYVARRVVRFASEDIGNADPRALQLALDACEVYERLGSPEGELAIAQAIIYLSVAAKSNSVYVAYNHALQDAKQSGSLEVPLHIRNAPTKLMKELNYGKGYRYPHDEPNAYAVGENYFPEKLKNSRYYYPVDRGLEIQIAEKLNKLRER